MLSWFLAPGALAAARSQAFDVHLLRPQSDALLVQCADRAFANAQLLSQERASEAEVVVVGGHPGSDYAELRAATVAIRNGARLFATGRDALYPAPDGLRPGAGAIVAAIETAGGVPAVVVGKPEPVVFRLALEALGGCTRVAVVGDHLVADVGGAQRAGLRAILVLTGVTRRDDLVDAAIRPDLVLESLAALPGAVAGPGG